MATTKKAADEPQPEQDAEALAAEQAKVQEQADKDRDEQAKIAQEAPGETPIPANFEDVAAHARVAEAAAAPAEAPSGRPDGEAST